MSARYLQDTAVRYFLEVVRCGSISDAALRLNVAGSAISRQIAGLEGKLNVTLFERRKHGMIPSAAGELLAAWAFRNQLETERVSQEITELQGLRRGDVHIASTAGFVVDLLPQTIVAFRRLYPGIRFHLEIGNAREVSRRLSEGESDIGLTFSQSPENNMHVAYRQKAPLIAIMPPDHPLAKKQKILLSQLSGYPVGMPSRPVLMRNLFDACCSRQGLTIEPVINATSVAAILRFAQLGGGIVISTPLMVSHYLADHQLVSVPLAGYDLDTLNIEVNTLAGRTLPRAASTFMQFLIEALKTEENSA